MFWAKYSYIYSGVGILSIAVPFLLLGWISVKDLLWMIVPSGNAVLLGDCLTAALNTTEDTVAKKAEPSTTIQYPQSQALPHWGKWKAGFSDGFKNGVFEFYFKLLCVFF